MRNNFDDFIYKNTKPLTLGLKIAYNVLPFIVSLAKTSSSVYLSYQFGEDMVTKVMPNQVNNTALKTATGSVFAVTAGVPLVLLSYKLSGDTVINLVNTYTSQNILSMSKAYMVYDALLWSFSIVSSVNSYYIPQYLFEDSLGEYTPLISAPAYVSAVLQTKWGLTKFSDSIFHATINLMVSKNLITNSELIKSYYTKNILNNVNFNLKNMDAEKITEIKNALNSGSNHFLSYFTSDLSVTIHESSTLKKALGYTAVVIGMISAYVTLPISVDAFEKNFHTPDSFNIPMGIATFLSFGALTAYTSKFVVEMLYDNIATSSCSHCTALGSIGTATKAIVALVSSTYRTQLTLEFINMDTFYGPPLIAAVTFSCATSDYWALDHFTKGFAQNSDQQKLAATISILGDFVYRMKPIVMDNEILSNIDFDQYADHPLLSIQNIVNGDNYKLLD